MAFLPRKSVDGTVKQNLLSSQNVVQQQNHQLLTRVPLIEEIPDQGFVLALISGTLYTYTRVGIQRYRTAYTAV